MENTAQEIMAFIESIGFISFILIPIITGAIVWGILMLSFEKFRDNVGYERGDRLFSLAITVLISIMAFGLIIVTTVANTAPHHRKPDCSCNCNQS